MPKVTLTFRLPEEREEFQSALHGPEAFCALQEVREKIFRPFRKHGFSDPKIMDLINQNPEYAAELAEKLEDIFVEILRDYELNEI
jgi:hypothetical protein